MYKCIESSTYIFCIVETLANKFFCEKLDTSLESKYLDTSISNKMSQGIILIQKDLIFGFNSKRQLISS